MATPSDDSSDAPADRAPGRSIGRRELLTGGAGAACVLGGFALGRATAHPHERVVVKREVVVKEAELDLSRDPVTTTDSLRHLDQPDAVFSVKTDEKVVGLSFDDGPDPRYTQRVLDLLKAHRAHATFFEIGVNALAYPELTLGVLGAGHTIGNHTYDHPDLELLPPANVNDEINRGEAALLRAGAGRPDLFRPPKGLTDEVVGIFADASRYRTIFWAACVEAFVDHRDIHKGVDMMLAKVVPGDVILAHDGGHVVGVAGRPTLSRERTMVALPLLLDGLAARGYRVIDIPRLLTAGPVRQGPNVVSA